MDLLCSAANQSTHCPLYFAHRFSVYLTPALPVPSPDVPHERCYRRPRGQRAPFVKAEDRTAVATEPRSRAQVPPAQATAGGQAGGRKRHLTSASVQRPRRQQGSVGTWRQNRPARTVCREPKSTTRARSLLIPKPRFQRSVWRQGCGYGAGGCG